MPISTLPSQSAYKATPLAANVEQLASLKTRGLHRVLSNAAGPSLRRALALVEQTYPHTYPVILCASRAASDEAAESLERLDKALENLPELAENRQLDWSGLGKKTMDILHSFPGTREELAALIEFLLSRLFLFHHLFQWHCRGNEPAENLLRSLQQMHIDTLNSCNPDREVVAELLFRWQAEYFLDFTLQMLRTYINLLDENARSIYRNLVEVAWVKYISDVLHEYSPEDRLYALIVEVGKEIGFSDEFYQWLHDGIHDEDSCLSVMGLYRDAGMNREAEDMAREHASKFPGLANILRSFSIDEKLNALDFEAAAREIIAACANDPDIQWYQELNDLCSDHPQELPWEKWREHLSETLQPLDVMSSASAMFAEIELLNRNYDAARNFALSSGCAQTLAQVARQAQFCFHSDGERLMAVAEKYIATQDYESAATVLHVIHKSVDDRTQRDSFRKFLRDARERFGLKGKKASLLRPFGI